MANECEECLVKDFWKLQRLVEKKMLAGLPAEVREPLLEAKKQVGLALGGVIRHVLVEDSQGHAKSAGKPRKIVLE